jgi:sulfofructose kinase
MISAIGIATVDHIAVIDGFHDREGTYLADAYRVEGGGMAATALCTASRLGSATRLFSRIGDDINGRLIIQGLASFEVDVSCLTTVPGTNSFVSIILVNAKTGEKQFYSDKQQPVFREHIDLDRARLEGTDVLLVDGFWMEAALTGARWASERGIPVVGDFKGRYDGLEELMKYVSYLIVPEFFARDLTGHDTLPEMVKGLVPLCLGAPVITCGSRGGVYLSGNDVRYYPAFPIEILDTTGAGDAFHGAFCHFLAAGESLDRCLELASAVGAINCRALGGRAGLPTSVELCEFLLNHPPRILL